MNGLTSRAQPPLQHNLKLLKCVSDGLGVLLLAAAAFGLLWTPVLEVVVREPVLALLVLQVHGVGIGRALPECRVHFTMPLTHLRQRQHARPGAWGKRKAMRYLRKTVSACHSRNSAFGRSRRRRGVRISLPSHWKYSLPLPNSSRSRGLTINRYLESMPMYPRSNNVCTSDRNRMPLSSRCSPPLGSGRI